MTNGLCNDYLEAIKIAFAKMKESSPEMVAEKIKNTGIDFEYDEKFSKNEVLLVKEYSFPTYTSFKIFQVEIFSSSVKFLLVGKKTSDLGCILLIFDELKDNLFFEIEITTIKNILENLETNKILPSLEVFQNLLPLRSTEVAELLCCNGFGCE